MKSFEVPILSIHGAATRGVVMALVGLCVLSGLDTPSARADFTFGTPMNLGSVVNTSSGDVLPTISADGCVMYFGSNRPGGYGSNDIYVTTRQSKDEKWGPVVNLGASVNSSSADRPASISADGLSLYLISNRPGGYGGSDLWMSSRAAPEAPWDTPVNLGPTINHSGSDGYESISADGLSLYFSSDRPGGLGSTDLWVATRATLSTPWGPPANLGPVVNSPNVEARPSISSDGLALFFSSGPPSGTGPDDIYVTKRANVSDPWGPPVNLGPPVSTPADEYVPCISADGSTLYFTSSRPGGYGNADIWQAPVLVICDFNGDGKVDVTDVFIMLEHWHTDHPLCDIGPMPWGDGIVDAQDLIVLAEHLSEGPVSTAIERRILTSSDDAEEALNPGYNNWNYSTDLEIVDDRIDNGGRQLIGLTFRNIDIQHGQVISNAYIEFVCDEIKNGTDAAYFLIWGHLTRSSEGFNAPYVISNRPQTQAKVPWEPDPWDGGGQKIQTVNIASIIQELIDQQGWAAGNAVEIIIGADPARPSFTGVRCAHSYDGSPADAPLLHIEIAAP